MAQYSSLIVTLRAILELMPNHKGSEEMKQSMLAAANTVIVQAQETKAEMDKFLNYGTCLIPARNQAPTKAPHAPPPRIPSPDLIPARTQAPAKPSDSHTRTRGHLDSSACKPRRSLSPEINPPLHTHIV